MAELVSALKKRFDIIYEQYDNDEYDGNYDDREVNNFREIEKLVEIHINKDTIKDTILNLLIFIDAYNNEYIYMLLLNHNYKFTNMIVLLNFCVDFSDHMVNARSNALLTKILFNSEFNQYFGKEIIITDDDIDGILIENNKNILVTEEPINIDQIFFHIKIIFENTCYFSKNINWDQLLLIYEETINKIYETKTKEFIKLLEYKKKLETYQKTNYIIPYPTFKLNFVKYKKEFDDCLALCNSIYDKTTNQITPIEK